MQDGESSVDIITDFFKVKKHRNEDYDEISYDNERNGGEKELTAFDSHFRRKGRKLVPSSLSERHNSA